MAKKANGRPKIGWIVGGIWVGVLVLGGILFLFMDGFSAIAALSTETGEGASGEAMPAASETPSLPTKTAQPTAPTSTREKPADTPTSTPVMIPTRTPGPSPTPIDFPTMVPTSEALWEGPLTFGYSVEGRPLEYWRFGRGERKYLVIAGIHGGYEYNTIQLADQLITYFSRKPDAVPTDATLYLIRALNPDGATMPHKKEGRSNANQVDLNRSFPVDWSADWNRDGCWDMLELNAGTHPASEPETIALMAFVLENPVIAVISYHSAAPGFYPAGEPTDLNSAALSTYLSKVTGYPYPAIVTGCYMTGSLVDWTLTTGAAGADVELSTHWDTEFNVNLNLVQALLRWEPEPEE